MKNSEASQIDVASVGAKLSVVWAGTFLGIKLSDLVLLATLIYTVIQIGLLVWDRMIKPWISKEKKYGD